MELVNSGRLEYADEQNRVHVILSVQGYSGCVPFVFVFMYIKDFVDLVQVRLS